MAWSLSCTDSSRSLCVAMGAKASSVKEDKDHIKTEWALKPDTSRGTASDGMRSGYDLRRWGNSCDEVQTCMTQGGRASAGTRSQEMGYQQVWPEEAGHQLGPGLKKWDISRYDLRREGISRYQLTIKMAGIVMMPNTFTTWDESWSKLGQTYIQT